MRDPLPNGFDLAVSMDTSFGYFDSDDDESVLAGLHAALEPGGRLLLDVLARDGFLDDASPRYWRELAGGELLLLDRTFKVATSRLHVDALIVDGDGSRHAQAFEYRLYTLTELYRMLERAGFAVLQAWGGFDGAPPSPQRARQVVLAERA